MHSIIIVYFCSIRYHRFIPNHTTPSTRCNVSLLLKGHWPKLEHKIWLYTKYIVNKVYKAWCTKTISTTCTDSDDNRGLVCTKMTQPNICGLQSVFRAETRNLAHTFDWTWALWPRNEMYLISMSINQTNCIFNLLLRQPIALIITTESSLPFFSIIQFVGKNT